MSVMFAMCCTECIKTACKPGEKDQKPAMSPKNEDKIKESWICGAKSIVIIAVFEHTSQYVARKIVVGT
jgi:hypothetical protein